jgi:hypothetical protein
MSDDPDLSFLSRHSLRTPPEISGDFDQRVLKQVESCRRQSAKRRVCIAGLVPLLLFVAGVYSLHRHTADPRCDAARAGTEWLLARQQTDGGWSASDWGGHERFSTGVGALATLALLYSPDGAPPPAVDAAGRWLVERFDPKAPLREEGPSLYNHLFSLHALLELESRSPDAERRTLLRQAVASLLRQQQPDGGWGYAANAPMGYGHHAETRSNSAITWWVLRILQQSEGLQLPGFQLSRERGEDWLARCFQPKTGPSYHPGTEALGPGAALFWMARLTGQAEEKTADSVPPVNDAYRDMFRMRSLASEAPLREIIRAQHSTGAWYNPKDRWAVAGGQIYTTAAAVLALAPRDG